MLSKPLSLEEAKSRRNLLTGEVENIKAQLGDRLRTDSAGRRLSNHEYWAWRKGAQHALNCKMQELRELNDWIKSNQSNTTSDDAITHLKNMCQLLRTLQEEDVSLEDDEIALFTKAVSFLNASA